MREDLEAQAEPDKAEVAAVNEATTEKTVITRIDDMHEAETGVVVMNEAVQINVGASGATELATVIATVMTDARDRVVTAVTEIADTMTMATIILTAGTTNVMNASMGQITLEI